jgi:hypothetical protein
MLKVGRLHPQTTHVLTIHGDKDTIVPVEDGKSYHSILVQRPGPGTASIKLVGGETGLYFA